MCLNIFLYVEIHIALIMIVIGRDKEVVLPLIGIVGECERMISIDT
jgi:hypothetical protein